jgi:hypothetical protein
MKRRSMARLRSLGLALTAAAARAPAPGASAQGGPVVPSLAWEPCAQKAQRGFDCASARVPLDYGRPAGRQIRLAVIRRAATDAANRIGTIFFNPGGPGGAGTEDLPRGFGHTELLNPSRCVARREVAYFMTGALPPPGTVCRQDTAPFPRRG